MEMIKITFLGTGNEIPTRKRNHTAILLNYKAENILLDCGEGTQRQFRLAGLSPSKLDKIFLTHWHGDHVLGLPGLFQTLSNSDYKKTIEIYGPKGTSAYIKELKNLFNLKIKTEEKEVETKVLETKEFKIESAPMSHGTPTLAYSFIIKDKLRLDKQKIKKLNLPNSPLLGKLQEGKDITIKGKRIKSSQVTYLEKGRKVAFILDTSQNANTVKIAKNSDLLICESSFSKEESALAKKYKHLTAEQAAMIAKKSNSKKLILTHISQRYEHNPDIILSEAKSVFRNVSIAKDFDVVEV